MLRSLNDLDRRILADDGGVIGGQWDLRHANAAGVFRVGGPSDGKNRLHR